MTATTAPAPRRPLGAYSRQRAALALLAIPVVEHLGMKPAPAMVERADWGRAHGVDGRHDFRTRGVRRG